MLLPPSSRPAAGYILGAGVPRNAHSGDTNETNLATVLIPAGVMGVTGQLEVLALYSVTNNANNKSPLIRHNTTQAAVAGGTIIVNLTFTTVNMVSVYQRVGNSATNAQVMIFNQLTGFGTAGSAVTTGTIDTTASSWININGTLANAGDTIRLESYIVRLIPSA